MGFLRHNNKKNGLYLGVFSARNFAKALFNFSTFSCDYSGYAGE